jgi:hypothetical protein
LCTSTYTLALPCSKFPGSKNDFRFLSLLFADLRDMTTTSSSSSYANALRGTPGPRAHVQALPLHHAPLFQENTIFVNLRGSAVDYTQKERDSFLKDDLGLQNEDVLDIFLDPSTLHLHLTLATSALFAAILDRLFVSVQWTAVGNFLVYGWAAAEPLVTVRVTGVPRRFSTSQLKRHFEAFGPVSKINRLPDRAWSSAASGVVQLLVQLRPGVVLSDFVNVVDPQGLLCERFAVYTEGRRRRCFRCGGTGHIGPFCKASCLAHEAVSSLWSSMVYNGPVLAAATAVGPSPSAAAAPATPSTAAEVVACPSAAIATVPSTASLAATPSCAVLGAPSIAAVVSTPTAAVAEAASKFPEAAASSAAVLGVAVSNAALVAARPTAADDAALTTTPPASRQVSPSPSPSGWSSSASDMAGAEDGSSETNGFHKPRRRQKRSPQSGSPGSMSPNQKTSKKESG